MPTVKVDREELFQRLGKRYTDEEFDELCFEFGIELDEVMTEEVAAEKRKNNAGALSTETAGARVLYYIAIPANRYDLLCIEGIARALNIFLGNIPVPHYRTITPDVPEKIFVTKSTAEIRPFVVAAILRNVTFTQESYNSFIELQDKLHSNICRKRTLVAIGTHDLDTLKGPFRYDARAPSDISFVPLSQTREFRSDDLLEFYNTDPSVKHIKPYVEIIQSSPVYPVITDSNGVVLSLPPIINGEHSKLTLDTRNVFVECTATDLTKAHVVLNTVVTMFSEYCANPFEVEVVDVVYEEPTPDGTGSGGVLTTQRTPDLTPHLATCSVDTASSIIGTKIEPAQVSSLCTRMGLASVLIPNDSDFPTRLANAAATLAATTGSSMKVSIPSPTLSEPYPKQLDSPYLLVSVPPTRADVLHEVDIIEDIAIGFGYNNIQRTLPRTVSTGEQLRVNLVSDHLRKDIACAGYDEMLTLALLAHAENFADLRIVEGQDREPTITIENGKKVATYPSGPTAVVLSNPQSEEFQICRTLLLPGLLKSLQSNKAAKVADGVKIFEVSDVMVLDDKADVGARNERHLSALYCGPTAGFEVIFGLVDRIFQLLEIPIRPYAYLKGEDSIAKYSKKGLRYFIEECTDAPTYFPGRGARIYLENEQGQLWSVGTFGVVHPEVLKKFDITYPVSSVEINIEPLF